MTSQPSHHLRIWRLLLPLVFQTVPIVYLPARAIYTRMTGQSVVLQTVPVDPYDLLRGYSISLTYDISRRETLESLEGSEQLGTGDRGEHRFYVILQPPEETDATPPPEAWTPARIARDRPEALPADSLALRGRYVNGRIEYGLETYYIPEAQRRSINDAIDRIQPSPEQADNAENAEAAEDAPIVVEVKVDELGNAVLTGIWIGDRYYQF